MADDQAKQSPVSGAAALAEPPGRPEGPAALDVQALFEHHQDEICAYLRAKFGEGPPEPDEIAQAAFAKLSALPPEQEIENPRAFLYSTARNLMIDELRKRQRRDRHQQSAIDSCAEENVDALTPERVLLAKERFAVMRATLQTLPSRQRDVLILSRIEGLTYTEIARRIGISETSVRRDIAAGMAQLHRAVKRMTT